MNEVPSRILSINGRGSPTTPEELEEYVTVSTSSPTTYV